MSSNNALHTAAKAGNLAQVQSLVHNFDINAKGDEDKTALCWAAQERKIGVVKLLLTFHPDVNIPDVRTLKMLSVRYFSLTLTLTLFSFRLHFLPPFLYLSMCFFCFFFYSKTALRHWHWRSRSIVIVRSY